MCKFTLFTVEHPDDVKFVKQQIAAASQAATNQPGVSGSVSTVSSATSSQVNVEYNTPSRYGRGF